MSPYYTVKLTDGVTALLKAIAEKLIPGIPEETRVVLLQQTDVGGASTNESRGLSGSSAVDGSTVLEEVIERATARQAVQTEIEGLCTDAVILWLQ